MQSFNDVPRLIFNKSLNSNLKIIRIACIEAQHTLIENSIAGQDASDIAIAIEEALSNIILHGFKDNICSNVEIGLTIAANNKSVDVNVTDNGCFFDFKLICAPDIKSNLSGEKQGGFGVYLIKKLMDSVELVRHNNQNILKMKKTIFSRE